MTRDHINNEMDTYPYRGTSNRVSMFFLIITFAAVFAAAFWIIAC